MKYSSSFIHLEHTPALDQKIEEASGKVAKFFQEKGSIKWSCYVKNDEHIAEINVHADHEYHAKAASDNLYDSINMVVAKIKKQAAKQKDKYNKLHRGKIHLDLIA